MFVEREKSPSVNGNFKWKCDYFRECAIQGFRTNLFQEGLVSHGSKH